MNQIAFNPEGARNAFETLKARIDAHEELRSSNVDIQRAAIFAASVGRAVRQPEARALFAEMPARSFEIEYVDLLESLALATWYISIERERAVTRTREGKLPPDLAQEGKDLRQRMLKLVTYHLEDHPKEMAELDAIRQGKSYMDLAAVLFRLIMLYELYEALLSTDRKHYRATDVQDASRVANRIIECLGGRDAHKEAQTWLDRLNRAWSLLVICYEEVSAAGRWLYRHDDDVNERFPSLYAVGRNSPRPRNDERTSDADTLEDDAAQVRETSAA